MNSPTGKPRHSALPIRKPLSTALRGSTAEQVKGSHRSRSPDKSQGLSHGLKEGNGEFPASHTTMTTLPRAHPPKLKSNRRLKTSCFNLKTSFQTSAPELESPVEQTHTADQTHRAPGKATTASRGPVELIPIPRMDLLHRTFAILYGHSLS